MYLTKGPSGWSESFDRKLADQRLMDFLSPVNVIEVIEAFLAHLKLEGAKSVSWSDVVGYLGHITQQDPDLIPEIIGVALWAQAMLYEDTLERQSAN